MHNNQSLVCNSRRLYRCKLDFLKAYINVVNSIWLTEMQYKNITIQYAIRI
jgi:hypothetical protein